ncbi:MAG: RIP metalloprotease RseP [Planctomycetota bacterium]
MSTLPFIATILGIGFMIFIHELGHYLAARAAGIRVHVFSLGFGPRLIGFVRDGTDYRLSLVPFGGYVLVAGAENFERRRLAADELNAKGAGARAFFHAGGVIMNVAFALIVFPLVFHSGVQFTAPVIGRVDPLGVAWQADLRPGDRILKVNGKEIYAFENLRVEIALAGRRPVRLEVERDGKVFEKLVQSEYDEREGLRRIGVVPSVEPQPPELIVQADTPAARAGLRSGDRLLAIDGEAVAPADVELTLQSLEHHEVGKPVALEVERKDAGRVTVTFLPDVAAKESRIGVRQVLPRVLAVRQSFAPAQPLERGDILVAVDGQPFLAGSLQPWSTQQDGADTLHLRVRRGQPAREVDVDLRLSPSERATLADNIVLGPPEPGAGVPVRRTGPDSPAGKAGLQDGDVVVDVGGHAVANWPELTKAVRDFAGDRMTLTVLRQGQSLQLDVTPARKVELGFEASQLYQRELYQVDGVGNAIRAGLVCSGDLLKQLYVTLKEMVTGGVSARNLGGIIQISRVSYAFAESGFARFLYFLAMLSLNLAFVNVLPIPVLDGGHLLFVLIEKIKGSPVSARVHSYSLTLGLVFIVGLMVFVTYNDILRLF